MAENEKLSGEQVETKFKELRDLFEQQREAEHLLNTDGHLEINNLPVARGFCCAPHLLEFLASMIPSRTRWLLVGLLCLALPACATPSPNVNVPWQLQTIAGYKAARQGNFAEAEERLIIALRITEAFGTQDQRYATTLHNLAALYRIERRYAEAEPLYKRSLKIKETRSVMIKARTSPTMKKKVLNNSDRSIAKTLHSLAGLYHVQGRYAEAEPLYMQALNIREKALGPVHSDIITSLNDLAALLRTTGRTAEAARMETRAETIRTKLPKWMAR